MQTKKKFLPQDCGNLFLRHITSMSIIALIFLTACSATNQANHYSKVDLNDESLISLYNDVPYVKGEGAKRFIKDLKIPDWDLAKQAGYSGDVIVFALIDENGSLEAAYFNKSGGELVDNAVIDALKESKFAQFNELTTKVSKYYLAISYDTSAGTFQLVPINFRMGPNFVASVR